MPKILDDVVVYHQRTKHHPRAMARGPSNLDWSNQPDPFRSYEGAVQIALERKGFDEEMGNLPKSHPLDMKSLSKLFFESLALSGQKSYLGSKWFLRVNPSSGNLHPTEGYLIAGSMDGLNGLPGVYHYTPKTHALEHLADIDSKSYQSLGLPEGTLLIALTSIYWRESWKYGERAFRYCMIDLGHALAAVGVAANCLGWKTALLDELGTDDLTRLLGLDLAGKDVPQSVSSRNERPDTLVAIFTDEKQHWLRMDSSGLSGLGIRRLTRSPNILGSSQLRWEQIDMVSESTRKPPTIDVYSGSSTSSERPGKDYCSILRKRRSAQAMDSKTAMSQESFHTILRATLPKTAPFGLLPWMPLVHPVIFAHRVEGLERGLYILSRDPSQKDELRAAMIADFAWERPPQTPEDLDFYLLAQGDGRLAIKEASCRQDIASDGCFAAAMIAQFEEPLRKYGPWFYSRLYWECGLIGQAFYLACEREGFQGCGIGCFFDDMMHSMLGLSGLKYQDLYHFTSGKALIDPRLTDLSPYD